MLALAEHQTDERIKYCERIWAVMEDFDAYLVKKNSSLLFIYLLVCPDIVVYLSFQASIQLFSSSSTKSWMKMMVDVNHAYPVLAVVGHTAYISSIVWLFGCSKGWGWGALSQICDELHWTGWHSLLKFAVQEWRVSPKFIIHVGGKVFFHSSPTQFLKIK